MPSADLLRSDQRYAPFLSDSFDPSQFASNALANTQTTAQAQIDHLQQGIAVLDSQLRQLVLRHREDLIKHASKSDEVDVSIQRISLSVRSLQSVAARVRAEVMEPYQDIATKTRQLENIQTTVHLLRQTIHRVKLAQRLRSDFSPGNTTDVLELAKAARLLSDIASTDAEIDLSGIDIIDQDRDFLASTNASVRMRIDAALRSGLETLSQADVGSALQALYNLRELKVAVYTYLNSSISSLEKSFSTALDARKLSAASTSTSSSSSSVAPGIRGVPGAFQGSSAASRLQDVLWERLGEACDNLWRAAMSAWHLQRVLMKKRDPISHQLFIDTFMNDQPGEAMIKMPLDYFWYVYLLCLIIHNALDPFACKASASAFCFNTSSLSITITTMDIQGQNYRCPHTVLLLSHTGWLCQRIPCPEIPYPCIHAPHCLHSHLEGWFYKRRSMRFARPWGSARGRRRCRRGISLRCHVETASNC